MMFLCFIQDSMQNLMLYKKKVFLRKRIIKEKVGVLQEIITKKVLELSKNFFFEFSVKKTHKTTKLNF